MPELGDIKRGYELGYRQNTKMMWSLCSRCGTGRWVQVVYNKARQEYCRKCGTIAVNATFRGQNHPNWKGGLYENKVGYIMQRLHRDSPFAPMLRNRKDNTIGQHRLVMAQHLGRCLESNELVHHINGIRTDNRIENLYLTSPSAHSHSTLTLILRSRIRELETEIKELKRKYVEVN